MAARGRSPNNQSYRKKVSFREVKTLAEGHTACTHASRPFIRTGWLFAAPFWLLASITWVLPLSLEAHDEFFEFICMAKIY